MGRLRCCLQPMLRWVKSFSQAEQLTAPTARLAIVNCEKQICRSNMAGQV